MLDLRTKVAFFPFGLMGSELAKFASEAMVDSCWCVNISRPKRESSESLLTRQIGMYQSASSASSERHSSAGCCDMWLTGSDECV